jgi:hypothetical protein
MIHTEVLNWWPVTDEEWEWLNSPLKNPEKS